MSSCIRGWGRMDLERHIRSIHYPRPNSNPVLLPFLACSLLAYTSIHHIIFFHDAIHGSFPSPLGQGITPHIMRTRPALYTHLTSPHRAPYVSTWAITATQLVCRAFDDPIVFSETP